MARTGEDDGYDLPDGVIPLRREEAGGRAGCAVTGCLNLVMVLFSVALIALLAGIAVRMWITR